MSQSQGLTKGQWMVLAAAFLGWMFDGVEIGLFPIVARPALQSLLNTTNDGVIGWWNSVIVASFLLGAALGGLVFGWLGDKIGRVRAMTLSVLVYSLFTGAGAFATQAWHLGALRFIASLGMGGEWAVAVALVMECWPERHRPKLAGAIGAASNIGFLLIAVVAFGKPVTVDAWRWIMLVGAAPAVLALFITMLVPESDRWKNSTTRHNAKPIREIFARGMRKSTILAIVFSSIPLIGTWAAVSGWTPLWAEQMSERQQAAQLLDATQIEKLAEAKQPQVRKAMLHEFLSEEQFRQIESNAARAKAGIQIVLAIGAIIGGYFAPVFGGIWGRRPVYCGLCLLSLLTCAWMFRFFDTYSFSFVAVALLVGGITASFYGWLPLYLPELFPTRVRATGQGLAYNFGRILAAVGSIFMGNLVNFLGGDYARAGASITLIYVLGVILIWLGPETKGKPLPE